MGELEDYSLDQAAGALALSLSALGGLLLVVWQSRCLCRCRLGCSDTCYIFDCTREPGVIEAAADEDPDAEEGDVEALLPEGDDAVDIDRPAAP